MGSKIYIYLDGSANKYIIKDEGKKILEFTPVKPEFSSSGIYDGGDYSKKEINNLQYTEITSIMDEAINHEESHIKNRVMRSGLLKIKEDDNEKSCIIGPDTSDLQKIEEFLEKIK